MNFVKLSQVLRLLVVYLRGSSPATLPFQRKRVRYSQRLPTVRLRLRSRCIKASVKWRVTTNCWDNSHLLEFHQRHEVSHRSKSPSTSTLTASFTYPRGTRAPARNNKVRSIFTLCFFLKMLSLRYKTKFVMMFLFFVAQSFP